jgi:hypothetical protein
MDSRSKMLKEFEASRGANLGKVTDEDLKADLD